MLCKHAEQHQQNGNSKSKHICGVDSVYWHPIQMMYKRHAIMKLYCMNGLSRNPDFYKLRGGAHHPEYMPPLQYASVIRVTSPPAVQVMGLLWARIT
jgi:hypothetical protein